MSTELCIFCFPPREQIFYVNDLVFGLWDGFPVSSGHALLITRRHVPTWFDATPEEQHALMMAISEAREAILNQGHQPDGYNIGINVSASAGQTVDHLHVHIIPRYHGDVTDPRGGVRWVIPEKANYLTQDKTVSSNIASSSQKRSLSAHDSQTAYAVTEPTQQQSLFQFPHSNSFLGHDDALLPHLRAHIDLAERVDMAVAFVMQTGIVAIEEHLRDLLVRGGQLRLLTGDYLYHTDPRGLRRLLDLEGELELRVFESQQQSFHPKGYIFHYKGGGGAAIVGSSNLSQSALQGGVEWNYRIVTSRDQEGFLQMAEAFEVLFLHQNTEHLTSSWIDTYEKKRKVSQSKDRNGEPPPPGQTLPTPRPHPIQEAALAQLQVTRADGNRAGLVVLATGLGKTWLSAFDSLTFERVLFVAHRQEILQQARQTFRRIRPDVDMGFYTGDHKTVDVDILFASIQTLSQTKHLHQFSSSSFDYIVVDEFHHAHAKTYRRLINYFSPQFLLALTATPERTDGGDLLQLCDENLVFHSGISEGIGQDLLCPFHYYGVPDTVDYAPIPWRSRRFDNRALTQHLATQTRAQNVLEQHEDKAGLRTLAFCCSKQHADFMKDYFLSRGKRAVSVHSGDNSDPRAASLELLAKGGLDVIFSVDMFNEGLDLPNVDTVMMLRPTESRILWLQQLGRGLRKAEGKEHLTVIDYIGNHRSFLLKPATLFQSVFGVKMGHAALRQALKKLQTQQFELPSGCSVTYDLEAVGMMESFLRPTGSVDNITYFYDDFLEEHNIRPTAVETLHAGYNPNVLRQRQQYLSWLDFVETRGGLTETQQCVMASDELRGFLVALEKTKMTKSYKMIVLQAMLAQVAFPGEISISTLVQEVKRIIERSARLRADWSTSLDNPRAIQKLLEKYPIPAWVGGRGTDGTAYFAYEDESLQSMLNVPPKDVEAFQELVQEIVDWRIADYLQKKPMIDGWNKGHIVCKIIQTNGRPILKLPKGCESRGEPKGWHPVNVDGEQYEANFVKLFVNVVRKVGGSSNQLSELMRNWFGEQAGRPGTQTYVTFELGTNGYTLSPYVLGVPVVNESTPDTSDAVLWQQYQRTEVPSLFGLTFNVGAWNQGYVAQGGRIFLFVTLCKSGLSKAHQYEDHFLSPDRFQWQSQTRHKRNSNIGEKLSQHKVLGIPIHLFVRRGKLSGGKAATFFYCGEVDFVSWEGDQPISVEWQLQNTIPERLWGRFGLE